MKIILQMTLTPCKMLPKVFSGKLSWKPKTNLMRSAKKLESAFSRARALFHSRTLALTHTPSLVISALASFALALSLPRSLRVMSPCPQSLIDHVCSQLPNISAVAQAAAKGMHKRRYGRWEIQQTQTPPRVYAAARLLHGPVQIRSRGRQRE